MDRGGLDSDMENRIDKGRVLGGEGEYIQGGFFDWSALKNDLVSDYM